MNEGLKLEADQIHELFSLENLADKIQSPTYPKELISRGTNPYDWVDSSKFCLYAFIALHPLYQLTTHWISQVSEDATHISTYHEIIITHRINV